MHDVFPNTDAVVGIEKALSDATLEGRVFSVIGHSDFKLKKLLAADIAYIVRFSGHSSIEAAQASGTTHEVVQSVCKGIVAQISIKDLIELANALIDSWGTSIPNFVLDGYKSTQELVEAQLKSNELKTSKCQ